MRRMSVSTRSKFKKMSSQVHSEFLSLTQVNSDSGQNANVPSKSKYGEDFEFEDHNQYLNEISTSINMETDLQFYKIKKATSNENMSIVTIRILESLREIYSGKNYLIRGYYKGSKFFEMAIDDNPIYFDIFETTLAYICERQMNKVYVLNVGGGKDSEGRPVGTVSAFRPFNCMQKPEVYEHQYPITKNNLLRFALTYFTQEALKMVFVVKSVDPTLEKPTESKIYTLKFDLNKDDLRGIEGHMSKNNGPVDNADFDVTYEDNLPEEESDTQAEKGQDEENLENLVQSNFAINKQEVQEEIDYDSLEVEKFLDFGTTYKRQEDYDAPIALVLLQDTAQRLSLFKADRDNYELHGYVRLKPQVSRNSITKYKILDACLIQSYKMLAIVEIDTKGQRVDIDPDKNNKNVTARQKYGKSVDRVLLPYHDKTYKIFVWEVKMASQPEENVVKQKVEFQVDSSLVPAALKEWRSYITIDGHNNEFYMKDYSSLSQLNRFNRLPLNNNLQNKFESFDMTNDIVSDIVGSHKYFIVGEYSQVNGILYKSFTVLDNLLMIAHGRYISIVEIQTANQQRRSNRFMQHLWINKAFKADSHMAIYNFPDEVHSLCLMDKDENNYQDRWKMLAIFQNRQVQEIQMVEQFLYSPYEPNQQRFRLDDKFLKTQNLEDAQLPGPILKIYSQTTDHSIPPFFLVHDLKLKRNVLCTIEYTSQKLKTFDFKESLCPLLEDSKENLDDEQNDDVAEQKTWLPLINIMNTFANNFLDIQILRNSAKDKENVEQTKIRAKVSLKLYDQNDAANFVQNQPESIPSELDNIKYVQYSYTVGQFIYYIFNNSVCKIDINKDECVKQKIIDNFGDMKIFDNEYFYWKVYEKHDKINPYACKVVFDKIDQVTEFRTKANKKALAIFEGHYPHLQEIYHDKVGERLATFSDYSTIKIWPLLHKRRIKLPKCGKKTRDVQVLGTQRFGQYLYSMHSDNTIKQWHFKTGQLIGEEALPRSLDLKEFQFHQQINDSHFLIKKKINEEDDEEPKTPSNHLKSIIEDEEGENGSPRKSMRLSNLSVEEIGKRLRIDLNNNQDIKITEYKLIRINKTVNVAQDQSSLVANSAIKLQQVSSVTIEEVCSFKGPVSVQNNNYGLYVGSDMNLAILFFRDYQGKLTLHYYRLANIYKSQQSVKRQVSGQNEGPSGVQHQASEVVDIGVQDFQVSSVKTLQYKGTADLGTFFSIHSSDFKYLLTQNDVTGVLEIQSPPCLIYNGQKQDEHLDLTQINKRIQKINQSSHVDACFLDESTILFMSEENIIMCYDFKEQKEVYFFTQCSYPGSAAVIGLDTIVKTREHVLGENCLILERSVDKNNLSGQLQETIAPNNFNFFFKQNPFLDEQEVDDPTELKYIQVHHKQKIELMEKSYYGSIFQSKEYQHINSYQTEIYLVHTFNYYDWRILSDKRVYIEDKDARNLIDLCWAQLPDGKTLLHKISTDEGQIRYMFTTVQGENKKPRFVPVLPDKENKNVFHRLFGAQEDKTLQAAGKDIEENAILLLESIQDYPFDLFKINISGLFDKLAEKDINKFSKYLNQRCLPVSFLTQVKNAFQDDTVIKQFQSNDIWGLNKDLVSKAINLRFIEEDNDVKIKVLDIPRAHYSRNEENKDNLNIIYEALYDAKSTEPYESEAIKALIEFRWARLMPRIVALQLIPYIIYMAIFYTYTIYDWQSLTKLLSDDDEPKKGQILRIILGIFVAYFCAMETVQITKQKLMYFKSVWNIFDLSTLIIIIVAECWQARSRELYKAGNEDETRYQIIDQKVRSMYSVVSLVLWLRVLYFFRIFRSTGYYIRMLVQLAQDILQFLFIFGLTIIAFGHAYFVFLKNHEDGPVFTRVMDAFSSTFLIAFGQYDIVEDFGNYNVWLSWVFFVLCLISLNIVLLNLIISIVSETYSQVKESYNVIMYRDLLNLIIENRFLFSRWCILCNQHNPNREKKYLILSVPDNSDEQDKKYEEGMNEILEAIKETASRSSHKQEKIMKHVNRENRYVRERLDKIEKLLENLLSRRAN